MDRRAAPDERRSNYPWWMQLSSRWADCDPYGHVNNAHYYSFYDTAITTLAIERGILRAPGQTSIGLCVASGSEFLAPIGFPQTVDVGVRLGHIGNSSLRYEIGLFTSGREVPAAVAHFVHVYVDRDTRRSVPLTRDQKVAIETLLVRRSP